MRRRTLHGSLVVVSVALAMVLTGCGGPVQGGPPSMTDVEGHLNLTIGDVPGGCQPVGLDGNGRGTVVGTAFDCPDGTTFRIERFDADTNDDALSSSPSGTGQGRVEWRDAATGDVIRVVSDDVDIAVLLRVAESIEVHA